MFHTRELERERAARQRRNVANSKRQNVMTETRPTVPSNNMRLPKHLNLKTYTYHSLGDYVITIQQFGTTDSYTTQRVSRRE